MSSLQNFIKLLFLHFFATVIAYRIPFFCNLNKIHHGQSLEVYKRQQRGSGAAPLRAAESGQHPAGTAIRRTGGNPEAGLWKTQSHLPKILRSGSKHRLQEIRLWNAGGLKTALHKYDNQSS